MTVPASRSPAQVSPPSPVRPCPPPGPTRRQRRARRPVSASASPTTSAPSGRPWSRPIWRKILPLPSTSRCSRWAARCSRRATTTTRSTSPCARPRTGRRSAPTTTPSTSRAPARPCWRTARRSASTGWRFEDRAESFAALRALSPSDKKRLFAACVARTLNGQLAFEANARPETEATVARLDIDFAEHVRPGAETFWSRVRKDRMLDVARRNARHRMGAHPPQGQEGDPRHGDGDRLRGRKRGASGRPEGRTRGCARLGAARLRRLRHGPRRRRRRGRPPEPDTPPADQPSQDAAPSDEAQSGVRQQAAAEQPEPPADAEAPAGHATDTGDSEQPAPSEPSNDAPVPETTGSPGVPDAATVASTGHEAIDTMNAVPTADRRPQGHRQHGGHRRRGRRRLFGDRSGCAARSRQRPRRCLGHCLRQWRRRAGHPGLPAPLAATRPGLRPSVTTVRPAGRRPSGLRPSGRRLNDEPVPASYGARLADRSSRSCLGIPVRLWYARL